MPYTTQIQDDPDGSDFQKFQTWQDDGCQEKRLDLRIAVFDIAMMITTIVSNK